VGGVPDVPNQAVQRLLHLLELERLDRDLFRAPVEHLWPTGRLFGGQVAAQALRAAIDTVEVDHHPHSLHGYFLRPGQPSRPVLLLVDRIRDGRSFTTRRVNAVQDGEAIFTLGASFHADEPGEEYAAPPTDDVPDPVHDPGTAWYTSPLSGFGEQGPFETYELPPAEPDARGAIATTRRVWLRVRADLGADRALHACMLTFVSDMGAVYAAAIPVHGTAESRRRLGSIMGASLDHAIWFHRPVRLDDWVLYDLRPQSNAGSRGLVWGTIHALDGTLGASIAQEALIRLRR
jgi:acyl-CoA thioesterase II